MLNDKLVQDWDNCIYSHGCRDWFEEKSHVQKEQQKHRNHEEETRVDVQQTYRNYEEEARVDAQQKYQNYHQEREQSSSFKQKTEKDVPKRAGAIDPKKFRSDSFVGINTAPNEEVLDDRKATDNGTNIKVLSNNGMKSNSTTRQNVAK